MFGQGFGNIYIDSLICNGSENRILDCKFSAEHDCSHMEDAGLRCQSKIMA